MLPSSSVMLVSGVYTASDINIELLPWLRDLYTYTVERNSHVFEYSRAINTDHFSLLTTVHYEL